MAERYAKVIDGAIHLAGGQMLIEAPVIDPSYHEITGGTRRNGLFELVKLPQVSQDLTDKDVHVQELNPNLSKDDIRGF